MKRATFLERQKEAWRKNVEQALDKHDWNIRQTAKTLGMDRTSLYRDIERFKLTRPEK